MKLPEKLRARFFLTWVEELLSPFEIARLTEQMTYYARTYITAMDDNTNQIVFLQEDTEISRIQQVELNGSLQGNFQMNLSFRRVNVVGCFGCSLSLSFRTILSVDAPPGEHIVLMVVWKLISETMISSEGFFFNMQIIQNCRVAGISRGGSYTLFQNKSGTWL